MRLHAPDYRLFGALTLVFVFGLFMLSSASSVIAFERFGDTYYFLKRQILLGVLPGLLGFGVMYRFDYRFLRKLAVPLFALSLVLLLFVLFVGVQYGGAQRWIALGPISFQPSELMKLTFVIYLSAWLTSKGRSLEDFRTGFLPFATSVALVLGLIVLQPDLGTTAVIGFVAMGIYFVAGAPWRYLLSLAVAGGVALLSLIALAPYRLNRLLTFLHPELDPQGIGYHINQSLIAIGSGGWWGRGFGHSRAKFHYLPEAAGDSVFSVIAEEMGFVLTLVFILLLFYVFARGVKIAQRAPDDFGRLLGTGIVLWFLIQSIVNIGALVGLLPLTGLPLPFISYGSSALVVTLTAAGVLLSISRQTAVH